LRAVVGGIAFSKAGAHIEKAAPRESELLGGLHRSGGACDYGNPGTSDLLRREHIWRTRASGASRSVGRRSRLRRTEEDVGIIGDAVCAGYDILQIGGMREVGRGEMCSSFS
jgi:hypothetical protein